MSDRSSRRAFLKTSGALSASSLLGAGLGGCAASSFPAPPLSTAEQLQLDSVQAVDAIRSGRIPAQTYVRTLLARAEALKDLNAMIALDAAGALQAAQRIDAMRDSGQTLPPLAGLPIVVKDNINTAGAAHHRRHRGTARRAAEDQRAIAAEAARCRRHRHRQDQPARAGLRHHQHQSHALCRRGEEPLRPHAHSRRLVGRHRGGHRRAHRAGRAGHRHRRLDARAGGAVRHRRPAPVGGQWRRAAPLPRYRTPWCRSATPATPSARWRAAWPTSRCSMR